MPQYYFERNGSQTGPVEASELLNQGVEPTTLVWHHGLADWAPAASVPELQNLFNVVPPPLPRPQERDVPIASEAPVEQDNSALIAEMFAQVQAEQDAKEKTERRVGKWGTWVMVAFMSWVTYYAFTKAYSMWKQESKHRSSVSATKRSRVSKARQRSTTPEPEVQAAPQQKSVSKEVADDFYDEPASE